MERKKSKNKGQNFDVAELKRQVEETKPVTGILRKTD